MPDSNNPNIDICQPSLISFFLFSTYIYSGKNSYFNMHQTFAQMVWVAIKAKAFPCSLLNHLGAGCWLVLCCLFNLNQGILPFIWYSLPCCCIFLIAWLMFQCHHFTITCCSYSPTSSSTPTQWTWHHNRVCFIDSKCSPEFQVASHQTSSLEIIVHNAISVVSIVAFMTLFVEEKKRIIWGVSG